MFFTLPATLRDRLPRQPQRRPATARVSHGTARTLAASLACAVMTTGALAASGVSSGVQGVVTLSPACGGAQREGADCRAVFANVELRLVAGDGAAVATTRSSASGQYRLAAPAGHYRLQVMTSAKLPRCPSPDVVVMDGKYAVVDIDCDTGMR